ncbi:hypothetical protein ABZ379_20770 [Streptomyces canus]|uniref:hypothetical protein n=1 Tax=Streptomyces canus TaxID=58343 RepID=UPI0033FF9EF3
MDIPALRYAVTLAEELHFGRAAQRHYISPQLFERTSRRVTLTPEGERLIAEARTLLDTVDSLTEHHHRRRAAPPTKSSSRRASWDSDSPNAGRI